MQSCKTIHVILAHAEGEVIVGGGAPQMWQRCLDHQKRRGQVHHDVALPSGKADLFDACLSHDARIVHQQVQPAAFAPFSTTTAQHR